MAMANVLFILRYLILNSPLAIDMSEGSDQKDQCYHGGVMLEFKSECCSPGSRAGDHQLVQDTIRDEEVERGT